jgi:hypothetical protein
VAGGIGSPTPGYGNFGPITVTADNTSAVFTYNGFEYGSTGFPATLALGTGGTMTFQGGDGTSVPAFNVSVTIPGAGQMVSPGNADGGGVTIDTALDLDVTWVPIAIGQIHFALAQNALAAGTTTASIACTFDGSSGAGVVSKTLLAELKAMASPAPIYASLHSELDATGQVSGLAIVMQSFQYSEDVPSEIPAILQ